jgi:hypothetical protein
MCIERISSRPFQTMAAHPDGSNRVFLSARDGKIFLATMPPIRSAGGALHAASPLPRPHGSGAP